MGVADRTVKPAQRGRTERRFSRYRDHLDLPAELSLHSLRHSCVTHLIEAGYDPLFVQQQVGHSYAPTTALYTSVSANYRSQTLRTMLDKTIADARARADHEES
ncbi:MAG TPA: tyrosine-type recombinase/integrase [Microlunatus sp.]|nr:tyrosine-type recombinase/integrase [Microlunatus sp.]